MNPDNDPICLLHRGTAPLLISMPHVGTWLPPEVRPQFTEVAAVLQDTDWHLDRLYDFAADMGASLLQARVSRYVVDVNRPPDDESLYPGQTTTGLCPTETFGGEPLYPDLKAPDATERDRRLHAYWHPYHAALRGELNRLRSVHGGVLLWEAHSIASVVPRLFNGRLPDFNFGTADGRSCDASLIEGVRQAAQRHPFSQVLNGRFKGGYITRHCGTPTQGIHAIQLEMCQSLYMNERVPFDYRPDLAARVQPALRDMLDAALVQLARMSPH